MHRRQALRLLGTPERPTASRLSSVTIKQRGGSSTQVDRLGKQGTRRT